MRTDKNVVGHYWGFLSFAFIHEDTNRGALPTCTHTLTHLDFTKHKSIPLSFILAILFLCSCSNELNMNYPSDPVPVVYSLLNLVKTDQYVRVGRSFQIDKTSTNLHLTVDSLIWSPAPVVYMEEFNGEIVTGHFDFQPVNYAVKDSGFFSRDGLALYRADFKVKENTKYSLYVYFPDLKKMVYGTTISIAPPTVVDPLPIPGRKISFQESNPFVARIYSGTSNWVLQSGFQFHVLNNPAFPAYVETTEWQSENTGSTSDKQLVNITFGGNRFYQVMSGLPITFDPDNYTIQAEYWLIAGGTELSFLSLNRPGTVTDFNAMNDFTNMKNGIGVFSSITTVKVPNLEIAESTLDGLSGYKPDITKDPAGTVNFDFEIPRIQGISPDKVHRLDLSVASTSDSLIRKHFLLQANVSDLKQVYTYRLHVGKYYYQAGLTCTALGDSCLWAGFPGGRFGSKWWSDQMEIIQDSTITIKIIIH